MHAQGVVHRDIKPDNLLLTEDDVLKIVDFGVSEMFEKKSDMMTAKSAGSPAFLPPELCVAKHGDISGKAADIWSMGVSLYCLRFGRIPFERPGVLELYEAIKHDQIDHKPDDEPNFVDLMKRILEKDPKKRIVMKELRVSFPRALLKPFINHHIGTSLGNQEWDRPTFTRRRKYRQFGRSSFGNRGQSCYYIKHETSSCCRRLNPPIPFSRNLTFGLDESSEEI